MKTALIVVILGVSLIGIGISYSPPLQEKFHKVKDDWNTWTPKRIRENTAEYLSSCKRKAQNAIGDLEVRQIEIRQKTANFEHKMNLSSFRTERTAPKLENLTQLYRSAEQTGSWPIKWEELSLSQNHAQRHILLTHKQIEAAKFIVSTCTGAIQKLNAEHDRTFDAIADAHANLIEIETYEQILAIQTLSKELENDLLNLKTTIQSVELVVLDKQPFKPIEVLAGDPEYVSEADDFAKIMAQ